MLICVNCQSSTGFIKENEESELQPLGSQPRSQLKIVQGHQKIPRRPLVTQEVISVGDDKPKNVSVREGYEALSHIGDGNPRPLRDLRQNGWGCNSCRGLPWVLMPQNGRAHLRWYRSHGARRSRHGALCDADTRVILKGAAGLVD